MVISDIALFAVGNQEGIINGESQKGYSDRTMSIPPIAATS
ncbi:MAG: hypothetical protein RMX96_04220 [Nostoc sp. ChiSLP02]|nr:hypothetical protein [Nostoc sp. DedSLP01]MDZ8184053.1 hypothetical protein [Nostoc sp. ChiSLP02]